jgi:hypothetical protein
MGKVEGLIRRFCPFVQVQKYVDNARAQGVSEESLVLTLDSLGVFNA